MAKDKKEQSFDFEAAYAMCELAVSAVKGERADFDLVLKITLEKLYKMSAFHSLNALLYCALEGYEAQSERDKKLLARFKKELDLSARKNILLDYERSQLFAYLDSIDAWYMPLKGVILKDMYPRMGMRKMSDNDILFDASYRKEVRDWFASQGYEVKAYGHEEHDVYEKAPVYNYEMHTKLFTSKKSRVLAKYYENVRDRLVKCSERSFEYRFTDEDFYIYFVAHGFRHFDNSGTGLRFLLDIYIYISQKQSTLDFDYLEAEFKKQEIDKFEGSCRALALKLFEPCNKSICDRLNEDEKALLDVFLSCGTYGTMSRRVDSMINKTSRWEYIRARLFPPMEVMADYGRAFGKYKILLPIGWVYRWIVTLVRRPAKTFGELRLLLKKRK